MDINLVRGKDSTASRLTLQYLGSLFNVSTSIDYKECNELLSELKEQRKVAGNIIPSEKMLDLEVQYNKWEVFKKTYQAYGLIGFLMLIIFFIQIFVTEKIDSLRPLIILEKDSSLFLSEFLPFMQAAW